MQEFREISVSVSQAVTVKSLIYSLHADGVIPYELEPLQKAKHQRHVSKKLINFNVFKGHQCMCFE